MHIRIVGRRDGCSIDSRLSRNLPFTLFLFLVFRVLIIITISNSNRRPIAIDALDVRTRAREFVRVEGEERRQVCVELLGGRERSGAGDLALLG